MADDSKQESSVEEKSEFKKPVLIGRIGKLPKKAKNESEKLVEEKSTEKPQEEAGESNSKNSLPSDTYKELPFTPVPYREPKWSGLCPDGSDYSLEVLKSGVIVDKIPLTSKPYYVFGRLANCDVVMAHPTISRYHCILQYKAFVSGEEPGAGWYIYELGSTHGTQLNREALRVAHYTRVRVGHHIKFGNSTRTYILQGPDFDCEGESELTVTEIKQRAEQMKLERDRAIQEALKQREMEKLEEERKREEKGIDWGMGEDAEEEPDLAENPYAATNNEELYLQDPKKTLRGYFEREGLELVYDCQERGHSQFLCRVELPLESANGTPVIAEVMHVGKKKEAVISCALEACRLLDRAGVLRQAKHESRSHKKRDWSADDYYDSDEDTFLDRTGHVEIKRNNRMMKHGADDVQDKPLKYEDLLKQISDIEAKIASEEKTLERLRNNKTNKQTDVQLDPLDEFMNELGTGHSMATKADISRTKMSILKLRAELSKSQRLADIARPAHLPPLIKIQQNTAHTNKRIKLKPETKRPAPTHTQTHTHEEFVEEMDSDEEIETQTQTSTSETKTEIESNDLRKKETRIPTSTSESGTETRATKQETEMQTRSSTSESRTAITPEIQAREKEKERDNLNKSKREKRVYGPMRPPENYVMPEEYFNQESDRDLPEITDNE